MTNDDKALVAELRINDKEIYLPVIGKSADRIEALSAEIERLREALELADAALRGANMNMNVVQRKVRAALGDTK